MDLKLNLVLWAGSSPAAWEALLGHAHEGREAMWRTVTGVRRKREEGYGG
jgi:hypothetical protein